MEESWKEVIKVKGGEFYMQREQERVYGKQCGYCKEIEACDELGEDPAFNILLAAGMAHRMERYLANEGGPCPGVGEAWFEVEDRALQNI